MEFIVNIISIMETALKKMRYNEFMRLVSFIAEVQNGLREEIQQRSAKKIKEIVSKLRENGQLTPEELQCIKTWIIGDAESYTEMENNFDDWLKEFDRLRSVVVQYSQRELSTKDLFKLQGILEDISRTSCDIANFLEKKDRIRRFEEVSQNLSIGDRDFLAEVLSRKLTSENI